MVMNLSVKKFLQAGLAIPVAIAITAASCGGSSSKDTPQGGSTQSTCEKVLKPLPLSSGPVPTPDPEQLTCLSNVRQTIGTLSEDNKSGQIALQYWQECKDALATWHAWTGRQSDAWFTANNMSRKLPGDCGTQPTPTKR